MGEVLRLLLHAVILWVLVRGLVGLAVSSGTQSLWALAAATAATVALAGFASGWLARTHRSGVSVTLRRLLPVPLLAGLWTAATAWAHDASAPQVAVAGGAWVVGALLGVLLVRLVGRRRRHPENEMRPSFA